MDKQTAECTIFGFLAITVQLSRVITAIDRYDIKDMFPCFDECIQHILRNSFGRFNRKSIGIPGNISSYIFTVYIWIIVVVVGI